MQKLKILIVSQGILENGSGLGRVHFELKQQYEKAGHLVDKIDYSDLYPKGQNLLQRIFAPFFTKKIHLFLKKNAHKYDVIDANFENIIYPKSSFNFKGLLFVRSHGIRPLYDKAYKTIELKYSSNNKRKHKTIRNLVGNLLRKVQKNFTSKDFFDSLKYADVVHCLNNTEYLYFVDHGIPKEKLIVIPNGYLKKSLDGLNANYPNYPNFNSVACIISWSLHKGIKDWREIADSLPEANSISILGSSVKEDIVRKDFDGKTYPKLKIIPKYNPNDLPALLKNVKVGIFPSYMEGFGFAVLEQMAAGIPVVAYRVPGVEDMLKQIDASLLVTPGDVGQLVKKTKEIFAMDANDYLQLSLKCIEVSKKYKLENISVMFLKTYVDSLNKLNGRV